MKYYIFALTIFGAMLTPAFLVRAANIAFTALSQNNPQDEVQELEVRLIPDEGESVNALEGAISLFAEKQEALVVEIEYGDSGFSLWPRVPEYNREEHTIRFTGGTISGTQNGIRVFRIRLSSPVSQSITVSWVGGEAYADDGLGTSIGISSRSLSLNIENRDVFRALPQYDDREPPHIEFATISRDEETFDGKYFLTVYATDNSSGVSGYSVKEGETITEVQNGPYVLRDQTLNEPLFVTVRDGTGNSVSIRVSAPHSIGVRILFGMTLVTIIAVVWYFVQRRIRRTNR